MTALLIVISGYLLGSIPSAYIASRFVRGMDIRELGDKNMGAANAFRQIGARAGVCVFLADVSKGVIAVLIAQWANISQLAIFFAGFAVVVGHNWPIFLGFRGGRGESTTIGVLSTIIPHQMSILLLFAGACLLLTHNVILASIVLFVPLPLVCWWFGLSGMFIAYSIALPCLVGLTHFISTRRLPADVRS